MHAYVSGTAVGSLLLNGHRGAEIKNVRTFSFIRTRTFKTFTVLTPSSRYLQFEPNGRHFQTS